jgi:hypothetical protein
MTSKLLTLTLAAVTVLGLSTLVDAASYRYRSEPNAVHRSYDPPGTRGGNRGAPTPGSSGGYSADPGTAALERLSDQYHNTY